MDFAIPLVEINNAALLNERTVAVVDPVAREGTAPTNSYSEVPSARIVRASVVHAIAELDLEVRLASHTSRRGHSGTPAGCLGKAHPAFPHFGVLQCRHGDRRHGDVLGSELQPGEPDAAATGMTVVDDLFTFDLDPCPPIRARTVVVGDPYRE